MKNHYISIIVILVLVIALLSISLINTRKQLPQSEMQNQEESMKVENETVVEETENINQPNNNENNMTTEKIPGLEIKITKEGDGAVAENGKLVTVHYTGKLEDGSVFDSSHNRNQPFQFALGAGMVIPGWEKGVLGMKIGEVRELTISSDLAYGPRGITAPDGTVVIPGGATLIFEVELLDLN